MERRVYELSSMLGLTDEQMIEILLDNGIEIKDYSSIVSNNDVLKLIDKLSFKNEFLSHDNKSSFQSIKIRGLFNKYNYNIDFEDDINIFIAENGSGKTTILNIIIATLKGDEEKLRRLPFNSLEVKVKDRLYTIKKNELTKSDISIKEQEYILDLIRRYIPYEEYHKLRRRIMTTTLDIYELEYIVDRYIPSRTIEFNEVMDRLREVKYLTRNGNSKSQSIQNIEKIKNIISEEILDFPTYRRIEEELDKVVDLTENERDSFRYKLNNSTLNFGIADVQNTIDKLTEKLRQDANDYYTKMNAEVLNDLLSNKVKLNENQKNKIDKDKIDIVIGRIGEDKIREIDKLRNFIINDSDVENSDFLQYYIFKLINIYEAQKPIDDKIKKYKDICNKYLFNKKMYYDEVKVKVMVVHDETNQVIPLDQLSSGEKQILSLFARLYLNSTKQSILIIDEPELSLSIIWQKNLLEDIYACNKIQLLIATTHSPFIFKNSFRSFAKELNLFKEGDL